MSVFEVYVEKKSDYAQEALAAASDLRLALQIENIDKVRIINRYYAERISIDDFEASKKTIFSEPPVDIVYDTPPVLNGARVFAVEYHPGQFDQRADSCAQCISLATGKEKPDIHTSKIYAVYGKISDEDFNRIKSWLINPVESREAYMDKPTTLLQKYSVPDEVKNIDEFISLSSSDLDKLRKDMNLAMDLADIQFCQKYFRDTEKRDPTITEIRVLDTYWSDHCRHTTFLTELDDIKIDDKTVRESYQRYLDLRSSLGRNDKPVTLMDMATIGARALKQRGLLPDLDESEEINACSVKIKVDVDGKDTDWLLMFKNETHNLPS
jgi:phosphoribosylformylglycinamidine synthase